MLLAGKSIAGGAGLARTLVRRAATLSLDWGTRQKSRFDAMDSEGRTIGVFLPRGTVLRGGDVLVLDDGSLAAVVAKAEPLLRVRAPDDGGEVTSLARAAYHLGNRHVALQVAADALQLEPDHVLAGMLTRMGYAVERVEAPFEPEAGAYAAADAHRAHGTHGAHDEHDHG